MIVCTLSGRLQGPAAEDRNGRVTASLTAFSRGFELVRVNITAYSTEGQTLLRFQAGDTVELTGSIEPRGRLDSSDNLHFVFELTASQVRRIGRAESA
jgi:hypothetical protein